MTFLEAIKTCFKKYCVFSGRASSILVPGKRLRFSEVFFFMALASEKYAGIQVKADGEEYLIVKNSEIIAVVE